MVIFLMFSSLLKVSKLQKSRKHKENHNLRKINCFFFFSFLGKSSGLEMAGWLAGLGAGQAGWAGRQAGWSWQLDGPASQPAISSPELCPKNEKRKTITLPEHPTCDNRYIMSFGLSFSSEKTIHIQLVRASTLR